MQVIIENLSSNESWRKVKLENIHVNIFYLAQGNFKA